MFGATVSVNGRSARPSKGTSIVAGSDWRVIWGTRACASVRKVKDIPSPARANAYVWAVAWAAPPRETEMKGGSSISIWMWWVPDSCACSRIDSALASTDVKVTKTGSRRKSPDQESVFAITIPALNTLTSFANSLTFRRPSITTLPLLLVIPVLHDPPSSSQLNTLAPPTGSSPPHLEPGPPPPPVRAARTRPPATPH